MHTARHSLTFVVVVLLFCATIATPSPAQTLTTLYDFCGQENCPDGALPHAGLLQGSDGSLYGTTSQGGVIGGSVFKVTPQGAFTILHTFSGSEGANPLAGLMQADDGNYYGTTFNGGTNDDPSCHAGSFVGCGTVFKVTPGGSFTTIYNFCSQPHCRDGSLPAAALVQGTDGNLYGTAGNTIFKITPLGRLTTLYLFCSLQNCPDGEYPLTLLQGADGNLYGTTYAGGTSTNCTSQYSHGCGTVFKITPQGTLTTLYSFDNTHGCRPEAGLVQGTDGKFFGTTAGGGPHGYCGDPVPAGGTVFTITSAGELTTLYSFCSSTNCSDGSLPYGELVQATDGNFYGTTNGGGNPTSGGGYGTIFKITPGGTFTSLYDFCSLTNCTDGILPYGRLIQAADGNLYGTTYEDGTQYAGTVYRFSVGLVLSPIQFVPITPCRLVDTRQTHTPIVGGTFQFFDVPQLGGCNIPATAAAYSLNVTAVPHRSLGYLTIWPAGRPQPTVSTMNSPDGRVKANAAIVPAGASAAVSVYATDTTDVILDINGYFAAPGAQTYQFFSLRPCRLVDTRGGHNGGTLQPGIERDYAIAGHCGIPSTATAYSFNVTVIPTRGELDYLTVWPQHVSRPTVSTLNDPTGTIVANAAIVPAGTQNATAFYAHDNPTDLLLDVNGYFAPAGTGGLSLYPVAPCRVLDTRGVGSGQPFQGVYNSPNGIDVLTSPCAPPSTSKAFVFNATVVPTASLPYLTLWPHGESQPNVSTLNATDGAVTSNMAIVPTNDGSIDAYAAGLTQLILDISGYFAP